MRLSTQLCSFTLLLTAVGSGGKDDCIPTGKKVDSCADRPNLNEGENIPVGSYYGLNGGDPRGVEDDSMSPDDPMGGATPNSNGSSACVEVENKSGNLSGPNGDVQNGGVEGDCIEVKICWSYYYPRPGRTRCYTLWTPGGEIQDCYTDPPTIATGRICSDPPKKVCPCGE